MRTTGNYTPRTIDRVIFMTLAVVFVLGGLYIVSPWYLDETVSGVAPIAHLIQNSFVISLYGYLLLIDGIVLIYSTVGRGKYYAKLTSYALLAGFLLRLYSFIGIVLTLESWRPPSYLPQFAIVIISGSMWVWVKVNERPI